MSTRSSISVKIGDIIKNIYCHYDGYPSHVGKILLEHYNSQKLAEKVVSLGDLSALYQSMDCPKWHNFDHPIKGFSIAYCRDRGCPEERTKARIFDNIQDALKNNDQDFNYFWDGERWLVDVNLGIFEELTAEIVAEE